MDAWGGFLLVLGGWLALSAFVVALVWAIWSWRERARAIRDLEVLIQSLVEGEPLRTKSPCRCGRLILASGAYARDIGRGIMHGHEVCQPLREAL